MSGDASYARMLWKMARDAHFDPEQDCGCPDCSPPLCASCGERVEEEGDYCAGCLEDVAIAESEWARDLEAAA